MFEGLSELSLVERARKGDQAAFVLLYERHRDTVFRFAWRMVGPEAAEDVAHDCFLQLLVRPLRFDPSRASLRTYLCGAARNQALKRLRDSGREVHDDSVPEPTDIGGPMAPLLEAERSRQVQAAVEALAPLQREVLILVEYEELSLAEVAQVVDADLGTVKARLHRARASLRRRLGPLTSIPSGGTNA